MHRDGSKYCYITLSNFLTSVICLHTVKWLNSCIWLTDGTLTDTTIPGQSEPGNNSNKRVLYISQSSRPGDSLSDGLVSNPGYSFAEGHLG